MKDNKGFTLLELLSVIILLLVILTIATLNFNKSFDNGKKQALIDEAHVFSEGAINKYSDDRITKLFRNDLLANKNSTKKCYALKALIGPYVSKDSKSYSGSVEVCTASDCAYKTKIWMTDGKYYLDGTIVDDTLSIDDLKDNKETNYFDSCGVDISDIENEFFYDFTGQEEIFTTPSTGTYAIELWGAEGGDAFAFSSTCVCGAGTGYNCIVNDHGGRGAYSYVEIPLEQGQNIYINVGEKGSFHNLDISDGFKAAYNGGGTNSATSAGGGGATHVSFVSGQIKDLNEGQIIAVAGGGGAAYAIDVCHHGAGQNAGGYCTQGNVYNNGKFCNYESNYGNKDGVVGSGGGYYTCPTCGTTYAGTGFIGNPLVKNGVMYCLALGNDQCSEFSDARRKTIRTQNYSEEPIAGYAKSGNGFVKITKLT